MTYDEMKSVAESTVSLKDIEVTLTTEGGESKSRIIEKIKKAYNMGYAKGYKIAQDRFRVDDIDLDAIFKA